MNYPTFLREVDQMASAYDANALRLVIHKLARTVSENDRFLFLDMLKHVSSCLEEMEIETEETEELWADADHMLELLEEIQDGGKILESWYNEEWEDDLLGEEDEFHFSDPDFLLDDIQEAVEVMHKCLDRALYNKGAELAQALSELRVRVKGDYGEKMDFRDLAAYDLLEIDRKKTVKEAVYLTYMGTPPEKRAEAMMTVQVNFRDYSMSLEEIRQMEARENNLSAQPPSGIEALGKE